ncbi:MAG: NADH-quinone oxidoreductase subunit H [Coriobacteriaceae bacterium]|nr:NADH-quinone oxidoreductase subunit H [Coriobacteriaceae bacterium]MDY3800322.1 complex I subunit 1 family protein [Eggerthellaceae bacterium]MDD6636539.1 NADH-quinone oxidoreductase subunit H [Coriobacteriaceae bacterium]MDD7430604.1 NADH-quinone oxidoreductase subunit H [Coriobacteriaceae bacterium]MDY4986576.1 complex I subunit 1 family protein [Eggerthellaceae bacterium]
MATWIATIIGIVAFTVLAPIVGCLLDGVDRKISARMQGRVGPSILQPYYDVRKLLEKERASVNTVEGTYIACALLFALVAGGVFFSGGNLLLCIFVITLSSLFFIMAAYSTRSPYAEVGAHRETLQVMCYEPMVLMMAIVVFQASGSFDIAGLFSLDTPIIATTFGAWVGLLVILTIKLRKSPFDISSSHHAHQEIVRGITTEMSGPTLAKVEILHWVENVLFMGWVGMFFINANPISIAVAIIVAVLVYLFEIWIDNNFARVKWQAMFKIAWLSSLVLGGVNIAIIAFI